MRKLTVTLLLTGVALISVAAPASAQRVSEGITDIDAIEARIPGPERIEAPAEQPQQAVVEQRFEQPRQERAEAPSQEQPPREQPVFNESARQERNDARSDNARGSNISGDAFDRIRQNIRANPAEPDPATPIEVRQGSSDRGLDNSNNRGNSGNNWDNRWHGDGNRNDHHSAHNGDHRGNDWYRDGYGRWQRHDNGYNHYSNRRRGSSFSLFNFGNHRDYGNNYDYNYDRNYGRNDRRWNRDWRRDSRYDWQRYRFSNQNTYRLSRYNDPFGSYYGYRRLSIGIQLSSRYYGSRYWINDPYAYRLPAVDDRYHWVRYYNDVLLVDMRTGYVTDMINDFFW